MLANIHKEKLIIIGASGHGKVVADIAIKMGIWKEIYFLDDNESIKNVMGIPVLGKCDDAEKYVETYCLFVAIGNNVTRERLQTRIESFGAEIPVLVHPSAVIGSNVCIGAGTAIMAGVIINSCTNIGHGCIINTSATLDHDNIIHDYVHISPGAHLAGNVHVGKRTWLGIGSIVSNNINICEDCIIGAGAVVVNDITQGGVYIGVPARRK